MDLETLSLQLPGIASMRALIEQMTRKMPNPSLDLAADIPVQLSADVLHRYCSILRVVFLDRFTIRARYVADLNQCCCVASCQP